MTRHDIKALFPDATMAAIDQLLDINSNDIGRAVSKGQATQDQLESEAKSLHEQIASLNEQVKTLTGDVSAKEKTISMLTSEHETAINDLNAQIKTAQERATVADTLTEQVAQLTKTIADRDATIANNSKQYKIKDELRGLHARNVDVVWPLLNLEKIKVKDGKLEGLAEQVEALKQSDAYLFDTNTGTQRGGVPASQDIGGTQGVNADMNAAIRSMASRG